MQVARVMAVAVLIGGSGLTLEVARSQQPEATRTQLQRHDLGTSGRETVQVRVDLGPGVTFPLHSHPGEEIVYVIKRFLEYRIEGKPPATPKAGQFCSFRPERSTA